MTASGLGRVKTQVPAACVEYLGRIAHRESQILLRTYVLDAAQEFYFSHVADV